MQRRARIRGSCGAVAAAALATGAAAAAAVAATPSMAQASVAAAAACVRRIHARPPHPHPPPAAHSHSHALAHPPALRSTAMGAVSRPSAAMRVPRHVLEQLAAPRGPAAPAVPEPVSAEEAAAQARMHAMWEQLAHTGHQGQQTTKAPPAAAAAASPALTAAAAARARVQAMMQRSKNAPAPPTAELRVQDADVLIKGQSLPIQWLLQELDHLVAHAADADQQSSDEQHQRLQRCDEILSELYTMVYPAPAHPANALSLDDYSCILRAVALDTQPAHEPDTEAADALDGVIAPVPPLQPSEPGAAEAATATATVELHTHTLPFVRLLLFQVENARPESLRDATMHSAELRQYIEQHQLDRPLLRLARTTLIDIVQRATAMDSTNPRAAASSAASAAADLLQRAIAQMEREAATAAVDADRPWQELLPRAFAPSPAQPASPAPSPGQTGVTPAATAAAAAPAFDDGSSGFDVQHVLAQLNHLCRVQHDLKKQAEREAQTHTSSVHNTRMQLQHVSTRAAQLLQDLHGALVGGAGAHIPLADLERVLTIHVPQLQVYHLALPLFEQLLQQRQMAYDAARASRAAAKSLGNGGAGGAGTRPRALPLPDPIPVRVANSVMACIPLAQPHSAQDALRMHKVMNALSPRTLCSYDVEAANRLLRSYVLHLQSSAGDGRTSIAARTLMFKEVKIVHHFMRLRNAATHTLMLQSMAWLPRHTAVVETFDFMRTDPSVKLDRHAYALYAEALLALLPSNAHRTGERNDLDEAALRTRAERAWEGACGAMLMTARFVASVARFWHTVGEAPRLVRVVCTAHELQTEQRRLVDAELIALALAAAVQAAPESIAADVQQLRALIQSLDAETQTQLQARTPINVAQFLGQASVAPAANVDTDAASTANDSSLAGSHPAPHSV